jgi:hypothetical protein
MMASSPVDVPYAGNKKKKLKLVDDASGSGGGRVSTPSLSRKALTASPSAVAVSAAAASQDKDSHPFPKGSVIEVLCPSYSKKDDWWSETESSDEEETGRDAMSSARLCDVIDRTFVNNGWRYYVHYRDFNRRMDEWIGMDRIVSPPSVGNAKARALKKKKQGHGNTPAAASTTPSLLSNAVVEPDNSAPRSRRRTSLLQEGAPSFSHSQEAIEAAKKKAAAATSTTTTDGSTLPSGGSIQYVSSTGLNGNSGVGAATEAGVIGGARRRRQSSRRKADDDGTVVISNVDDDEQAEAGAIPQNQQQTKLRSKIKSQQIVLPDAVTTHTVGEHVVATVHAQELDEHEGLDEASLREHEEVTKVKNVNFLELGEFQMETWYVLACPCDVACRASSPTLTRQPVDSQVLLASSEGALWSNWSPRGSIRVRVHFQHVFAQG